MKDYKIVLPFWPTTKRPMQQNAQCNKTPNATKGPKLNEKRPNSEKH